MWSTDRPALVRSRSVSPASLCAVRANFVIPVALVAATVSGCGGGSDPGAPTGPAKQSARLRLPSPRPVAVQARKVGTLPAPVQLPAVALVGGRSLIMGGLDAPDGSVS